MDLSALERSISNLERSLDSLETLLFWMTALVVIGLVVEYRHEIPDEIKKLREAKRFLWRPVCVIIGGILITVGVGGELVVQFVAGGKQTALRRLNHSIQDELRLERVRIGARVAWRHLTDQQKSDIGSDLRTWFSGQRVSFWFNMGDPESSWFAADIADAVSEAHELRVFPPGALMTMMESGRLGAPIRRVETGVVVQSTGDEPSRRLADALIHELTVRGFDAARQTDPPFDSNPVSQVWVYVDARPMGPQGEFKLAAQNREHEQK